MGDAAYWNAVYDRREDSALTWYEPRPALSLELIAAWAGADGAVLNLAAPGNGGG